jgi:hypothetical protein
MEVVRGTKHRGKLWISIVLTLTEGTILLSTVTFSPLKGLWRNFEHLVTAPNYVHSYPRTIVTFTFSSTPHSTILMSTLASTSTSLAVFPRTEAIAGATSD